MTDALTEAKAALLKSKDEMAKYYDRRWTPAVRGRSYELSTWYSTLIPYLDLSLSYSPIAPPMPAYLCLVIIQMFHVVL